MKKIVIFGAGSTGKREFNSLSSEERVIAFFDNDMDKWNTEFLGVPVYEPSKKQLFGLDFDQLVIASVQGYEEIRNYLLDCGVPNEKIRMHKRDANCFPFFLNNLKSLFVSKKIDGSIAEAGVYRGDSAALMNEVFCEKKLYLFDTFEGFDVSDTDYEKDKQYSSAKPGQFANTSEQIVMNKMKYPDKVIIRKGYFPNSAAGISDHFCFVRLDMDLYLPTKQGLDFFHDKMVGGGVIVVHDYFGEAYPGVKDAVDEYISEKKNLSICPMGDRLSIIVVGY